MHPGERHHEAGDAADPDRGAELVQRLDGEQQVVVGEPRLGMGGERRRDQLDRGPSGEQQRVPGAAQISSAAPSTAAAAIFTMPAMAKLAPSAFATEMSTVPTSTAICIATAIALGDDQAERRPGGDARRSRRGCPRLPGRLRAKGRASSTRNSVPPSIIDCAMMTRPWTTMLR